MVLAWIKDDWFLILSDDPVGGMEIYNPMFLSWIAEEGN